MKKYYAREKTIMVSGPYFNDMLFLGGKK